MKSQEEIKLEFEEAKRCLRLRINELDYNIAEAVLNALYRNIIEIWSKEKQ